MKTATKDSIGFGTFHFWWKETEYDFSQYILVSETTHKSLYDTFTHNIRNRDENWIPSQLKSILENKFIDQTSEDFRRNIGEDPTKGPTLINAENIDFHFHYKPIPQTVRIKEYVYINTEPQYI